jgi:quercetin dioxygenase-like cupin family protein
VNHLLPLLPAYVLGELGPEQTREIEALSAESPALRREIDQLAEALARTVELLPRVRPPGPLRARLLDTLAGVDRFAPFLDQLTRLFELPVESLRRLLARIDGGVWEKTLQGVRLQGTELFHFQVGARLAAEGAAGGVVRVRAGQGFPRHTHHGDETTFVLEGGYVTGGRTHGPGATLEVTGGTEHTYLAAPERDLVIAVLHRGIAITE